MVSFKTASNIIVGMGVASTALLGYDSYHKGIKAGEMKERKHLGETLTDVYLKNETSGEHGPLVEALKEKKFEFMLDDKAGPALQGFKYKVTSIVGKFTEDWPLLLCSAGAILHRV